MAKQVIFAAAALAAGVGIGAFAQGKNLGYTDTPFLPGGKWHVHDGERPVPKVVDPGTPSTQEASGRPPSLLQFYQSSTLRNLRRQDPLCTVIPDIHVGDLAVAYLEAIQVTVA